MDLITPDLRIQLLANGYAARDNRHFDPWPVLRWFNPCGASTWLITELDPDDGDMAYGLADLGLGSPEPGHVSVRELASIQLMRGILGIERDLYWRAAPPERLPALGPRCWAHRQLTYPPLRRTNGIP